MWLAFVATGHVTACQCLSRHQSCHPVHCISTSRISLKTPRNIFSNFCKVRSAVLVLLNFSVGVAMFAVCIVMKFGIFGAMKNVVYGLRFMTPCSLIRG